MHCCRFRRLFIWTDEISQRKKQSRMCYSGLKFEGNQFFFPRIRQQIYAVSNRCRVNAATVKDFLRVNKDKCDYSRWRMFYVFKFWKPLDLLTNDLMYLNLEQRVDVHERNKCLRKKILNRRKTERAGKFLTACINGPKWYVKGTEYRRKGLTCERIRMKRR